MSTPSLSRFPTAATVFLLAALVLGCGTKEYESRLDVTVSGITQGSVFETEMYAAKVVPGTKFKLQVPNTFGEIALQDAGESEPIDPRRLTIPIESIDFKEPLLKLTYEGWIEWGEGGDKVAFYCYVAASKISESRTRKPILALKNQISSSLGVMPSAIKTSTVGCRTPQGRTVKWQRFQVEQDQEFCFRDANDQPSYRTVETATMVFYSQERDDHALIIGWRVPTDLKGAGLIDLEKWAPKVAGSLDVDKSVPGGMTPDLMEQTQ